MNVLNNIVPPIWIYKKVPNSIIRYGRSWHTIICEHITNKTKTRTYSQMKCRMCPSANFSQEANLGYLCGSVTACWWVPTCYKFPWLKHYFFHLKKNAFFSADTVWLRGNFSADKLMNFYFYFFIGDKLMNLIVELAHILDFTSGRGASEFMTANSQV